MTVNKEQSKAYHTHNTEYQANTVAGNVKIIDMKLLTSIQLINKHKVKLHPHLVTR